MLKEFFRDKSAARLLMIAAAVLLFVSQFFNYFDDADKSYLTFTNNGSLVGPLSGKSELHLDLSGKGIATGWQLHSQAYLILVVLAFALLRDDIADTKWFGRLGYWAALILILVATTPGAPFRATGALMGTIAILMALVAALMNLFGQKSVPPPLK
jgi:hypothetical protein